jgi:NADH:ubiquinone oxidoreductase subunit 2 (subunit N)
MPFGSDLRDYLLVFAFINLFIGLFSAIGEKKSFRRFFVFSSVTHFGHIIVALSLLTTFGFMLALTYLIIYLFIFFIIYYKLLEKRDLNSDSFNILTFSVLNEKTRLILLLTLLSLTGLPLFPFFFCKIFIILNY